MHFQAIDSTCAPNAPSRFVLAGTQRRYERSRPFALQHQALEVELDIERRSIDARATLHFCRIDPTATSLELDAVGFDIESIHFVEAEQTHSAQYTYDGDQIRIEVPLDVSQGCVEIDYRATPRRGLYFLAPDAEVPGRPRQVWSQCQDEDARHWFPCHDAPHMKLTSELIVTVPKQWVALSNGTCVGHEIADDAANAAEPSATFHFRLDHPHPSYLVTLVAGEFSVLEDRFAVLESGRRIPVRYYVPVGREADAWRGLADTPTMIELFSRLTGLEYPFDSYAQVVVHDFIFGGMENTTATTLYEHVLLDERAAIDVDSRSLVAHELAHQWFGDTLTCRDWPEAWLNEGFATFFEHVERESHLGRHEYDWSVLKALESYLGEFNEAYDRPIVCRDYMAPIDLFDRHLYEKGSLVLHMLRRRLGDEVFWSALRDYVTRHQNEVVETHQFWRTCERISGQSLDRFFDDWVYRSGHPELTLSATYEGGRLIVTLKQEPKGSRSDAFAIPFEISVQLADGTWHGVRRESQALVESIVLELPKRPLAIAFDPELRVTAPVKLELGFDWLKQTLNAHTSLRSRLLAASALGSRQDAPSQRLLREVLVDATQPYILRIECARSLGKTRTPDSIAHLSAGASSERAEVRKAVATALSQFQAPQVLEPLTELVERDPSYLVRAEACRAMGRARRIESKPLLLSKLREASWADVVRSGAIDGLAELRDPELVDVILAQTRYGVASRARRAAVLALGRVGTERATRVELEQLLDDPDPHLRADVVDALVSFGQAESIPRLASVLRREVDPRVQRRLREALRDLGGREPGANKRLSDEVVELRSKLEVLEARLSRLEPPSDQQGKTKPDRAVNRSNSKQTRKPNQQLKPSGSPKRTGATSARRKTVTKTTPASGRASKSGTGAKRARAQAGKTASPAIDRDNRRRRPRKRS